MYQDFKDLLSAFHAYGVKYLIVGGYAVSFRSQPRATKDIDLFIKADQTNGKLAYTALAAFGTPIDGVVEEDFAKSCPVLTASTFDTAWERRVESVIDEERNQTAFFISREDLITAKLTTGRLRDLADVEEIREAAESQPNPQPEP